jgi:hypothetical protein
MPNTTCFSYQAGGRSLGAAQPVPPGVRRMPLTCFTYSADRPVRVWGVTGCPVAGWCFSYPTDVPPAPSGLRRMPVSPCFRY